jgi:hypothetical protein
MILYTLIIVVLIVFALNQLVDMWDSVKYWFDDDDDGDEYRNPNFYRNGIGKGISTLVFEELQNEWHDICSDNTKLMESKREALAHRAMSKYLRTLSATELAELLDKAK